MHYSYYKRPLLLLLIGYIIGLVCFYTPRPGAHDVSRFVSAEPVTLTGTVIGFPSVKKESSRVVLQVAQVDGQKANGKVYARFNGPAPAWHETVQVTGRLKKPYSIDLLGNFAWADYLASQHIFAEIKVTDVQTVRAPGWFFRAILAVRQDILQTFEKNFDRSLSAIAGGVLLGERGEMDEQLYADFQNSGAIHLLVASGGNVGFVTLIVFAICSLFAIPRKKTVLLALGIAGIYTLIAGADAPLMRAYFMTVCAVTGYFLHRNSGVFQGLILSCLIILLCNPAAVFETGFQMSFLATLAIIICLNNYELPYYWPRWVKFFVQIFLATLSTQLILLPVFTNTFFRVPMVGLLSNMILVPWASLLMAVSFAFYIFSCLHIGFLLTALTGWLLNGFAWAVQSFAALPFASFPAAAWRASTIAAYYVGLFLLFHLPKRDFCKRMYKPLLVVIMVLPLMQFLFFNPPTVWLLNEWNKNSILLRTPGGQRVLIGAEIAADKLARAVRKSGAAKVDLVLLSQASEKELQNVEKLRQELRVGNVFTAFENAWPGEEIHAGKITVLALWGRLLNRAHTLWINKGYTGHKDNLSYQITLGKRTFTTAGNNRFILYRDQVFENKQNATRAVKL